MIVLQGKVTSGTGDFGQWIEKLKDHYFRKTDLWLFPGTLNLKLEHEFDRPENSLRLKKEEYGGEVSVNIIPRKVLGHKAFILRPYRSEINSTYDKTVVEIATDIKLRDAYNLREGDEVEVSVE